jgi:spermidine/putrescine transport system ATP-binding protein
MGNDIIIQLNNLTKIFDGTTVVDNLSLSIKKGEFVTFLGPSGCGKTTTLRMIAGFEIPNEGTILLNGNDITKLPPYERPVNTVFQRYALFPHLDVYDNIAFGLRLKKVDVKTVDQQGNPITEFRKYTADEIDDKVMSALKIVDLEEFEDRDVTTLSGGQQQRVAIARAIVNSPQILLLDEPLGALDLKMRKEMQMELKEMHRKLGITFIYVTHDQEEALTMSDTIVVMKDGVIQQIGTPTDIYNEPVNAYVANFIGESNIYNATSLGHGKIRFLGATLQVKHDYANNEKLDVILRPEDIYLVEPGQGFVDGIVQSRVFKGVHYEYVVMVGKAEVIVQDVHRYELGQKYAITFDADDIHIMEKEFTVNSYKEAWINDKNNLVISDAIFEVDVTQLLAGSRLDEQGYLIGPKGVKYNLKDYDVSAEIPFTAIEFSGNPGEGQISGHVIQTVWKGDHYQMIARTFEEEDFVADTEYSYEEGTEVGIQVDTSKIKLIVRGNLSEHEV